VSAWFSGGKGLTRIWSEAEILSISFHSQKVHWGAIFLVAADFQLHSPHQTHSKKYSNL